MSFFYYTFKVTASLIRRASVASFDSGQMIHNRRHSPADYSSGRIAASRHYGIGGFVRNWLCN